MSGGGTNGGIASRRAVGRWARRLFRREWRQHVLIVSLLTVAVGAATWFSCLAYNIAPAPGHAEFGDADHFVRFDDPDPATLPLQLDAAREWFGAIDPIGHRAVPIPGTVVRLDHRSQDPDGPFGQPLLELRSGRAPVADDEAAVTDWVADQFDAGIGSTIDLDGVERTVVGIVDNPAKLDDEFVLLAPSLMAESDSVTLLVKASQQRVQDFRAPDYSDRIISSRTDVPEDVLATMLTLVVSTVVLFLVALVAAASFTVIAQRRLPQLGMMAAVGANEKQLRMAMLASGAVSGVVAAVLGTAIGLAGWYLSAPAMGRAVGYRIDEGNLPWWALAGTAVLAVAAAVGAAWWPARTMSRIPPVLALSGRPPRPAALHRSALLSAVLIVGGAICLSRGAETSGPASNVDLALVALGLLAIIAGVLLVSPLAVRALARSAGRAPVASRLALRDLGRYQARSGSALAAIALALGIPVALVATTAAAENNAGPGNLPADEIIVQSADVEGPFLPDADTLADVEAAVDDIAGIVPGATVIPLEVATDPEVGPEPGVGALPAVALARPLDNGWEDLDVLHVVSPELLALYGLDADDLRSGTDILTSISGELELLGTALPPGTDRSEAPALGAADPLPRSYTSHPQSLITAEGLAERGWTAARSGQWLIRTDGPLSDADLEAARIAANAHGAEIESRSPPESLARLRLGSLAVGIVLALGVLAMTVGLIRAESTAELRTLTASGATSSTRRSVTATTAGGLAALGAVIGIAGAYLTLAAGHLQDLFPLPTTDLLVIAVGMPAIATAAGWLLAGREPPVVARRPLE